METRKRKARFDPQPALPNRGVTPERDTPPHIIKYTQSTPVVCKIGGHEKFAGEVPDAPTIRKQLDQETEGHFVGPMPPQTFLDTFVRPPASTSRPEPPANVFRDAYPAKTAEVKMYNIFVEKVHKHQLMPNFTLCNTSSSRASPSRTAVDVTLYKKERAPSKMDFCRAEALIEIKNNPSEDPFESSPRGSTTIKHCYPFEKGGKQAADIRGQVVSYISEICRSQLRCFGFLVLIIDHAARLLRWDPSGIVVSEAFNYLETNYLSDFLWRFNDLSDEGRGCDPSITKIRTKWPVNHAPLAELKKLQSYNQPHSSESSKSNYHQYYALLMLPDRDDPQITHKLVISYPPAPIVPKSPLGRQTTTMYAWDITLRAIVFLKQYWRAEGSQKEGEVYRKLHDAKVRHLPVFGQGNDVPGCETQTQNIQKSQPEWLTPAATLVGFKLYRMTLCSIGRPLTAFRSSRELVMAVRDAMICHDDAWFLLGILHRDISVGNIMITQDGRSGFLIDWELSVEMSPGGRKGTARPYRTLTWQFMSARLLKNPKAEQTIVDDRESAFWVLVYASIHYLRHNQRDSLGQWEDVFNESEHLPVRFRKVTGGKDKTGVTHRGGWRKVTFIKDQEIEDFLFTDNEILQDIFLTLQNPLIALYKNEREVTELLQSSEYHSWMGTTQPTSSEGGPEDVPDDPPSEATQVLRRAMKRGAFTDQLTAALDSTDDKEWPTDDAADRVMTISNDPNPSDDKVLKDNATLRDRAHHNKVPKLASEQDVHSALYSREKPLGNDSDSEEDNSDDDETYQERPARSRRTGAKRPPQFVLPSNRVLRRLPLRQGNPGPATN